MLASSFLRVSMFALVSGVCFAGCSGGGSAPVADEHPDAEASLDAGGAGDGFDGAAGHSDAALQDSGARMDASDAAVRPAVDKLCDLFCTKSASANCSQSQADCLTQCHQQTMPGECAPFADGLLMCAVTSGSFDGCSASGLPTLMGCDCEAMAFAGCSPGGSEGDIGFFVYGWNPNTGYPTETATCDACALASCCSTFAAADYTSATEYGCANICAAGGPCSGGIDACFTTGSFQENQLAQSAWQCVKTNCPGLCPQR